MEQQEAVGGGGSGSEGCNLHGAVSDILEGGAAGLHSSCSSLYSAGFSPRSVSSSTDERPRGILKNTSTTMVQRVPSGEKKKSQHWDEMNILATYHPLGKDYGLMKVDEPSTPYHRLEDSDEDLRAGTSQTVTPEVLAERLASLDSFCPKVLQFGDNKNTSSKDKLTSKKDFEFRRKAHYDEGKYLKAHKLAAQDDEEETPDTPGGGGHALPQPPPDREFDRRRKEYYSKGTYLKVAIPTDSEEDTDKEQKGGTSGLTWVIEKPLTSQGVHLLGLAGQAPNGEQKAKEKPLTITIAQSQPGTAPPQNRNGSPVMSGWCHWLVTKELSWKSPGIPDRDAGESQGNPGGPERRPPEMTVKLDFEECLKDSPRFRASIESVESDVSELENRLEKLLKLGSSLLESGRHYLATCRAFISGIQELSNLGSPEPMMTECLDKFTESLSHKINCQEDLLNATQQTLKQQIQSFVKESLRGFWEVRRDFWRGAECLETALSHNAEVPRRRAHEAEEAMVALKEARKGYQRRALDYVLQINVILDKRKFDIMEFVLRLVEAQAIYFQLGHEELSGLGVYHKELGAQLHKLVLESAREKRDMEQRHVLLKEQELNGEEPEPGLREGSGGLVMEGHLFKRASNAFKTWSRRWFTIQNNQLVYQKRYKDPMTVVVDDLRLCTVKLCPDSERRFCFEVVSPSKSCLLQADSEQLLQLWVNAVQSSIATAFSQAQEVGVSLNQGSSHSASGLASTLACGGSYRGSCQGSGVSGCVAAQVQSVEGNAQCCDCREPAPEWASINLGVTLCIQCSGIHRSLGVHFSKVRSLTLDSWEPELVKLMCELGNVVINQIYEARIQDMSVKKPGPTCSRQEKEAWIQAKYVEKKFLTKLPMVRGRKVGRCHPRGQPPLPPKPHLHPRPGNVGAKPALPSGESVSLHPGALLFWAAGPPPSLPTMADALAHGADVNWVNGAQENATPLIQATSSNSLLACEFLLQNGASVNQADSMGRSPLHHATILGHTGLACLFLKRGADLGARDSEGKDPFTIAMDTANADIVTLLRLAKMREAEVAQGQAGDETYLDIFRDFSLMASDDPEKLSRRSHNLHTL